jgi:hypothetical protein
MKDLLLVVPSRGRPGNVARLLEAMDETCRGDTTLVLGLDDDDPELPAYGELLKARGVLGKDVEIRGGLRQVVAWVNQLAVPRAPEYRFTGHIGDDNVPRTAGWDVSIMEALGKTPFAFGNDLYPRAPGTLCCHVFMRSEVITKLGYFGPPSIRHMYVDVSWMAWGQACGITYLHDVIIEHLHYTVGKAPADESYARSTALITGGDLSAWHAYSRDDGPAGLNADIARLGGAPFTDQGLRDFNAALNIPDRW